MNDSYQIKEKYVINYFGHIASADDFARAYSYMNCIVLKDYSNHDEFIDDISPTYIVLDSDNDGIPKGEIVQWSTIAEYMDGIISAGAKDDVECLYCHLTDKY